MGALFLLRHLLPHPQGARSALNPLLRVHAGAENLSETPVPRGQRLRVPPGSPVKPGSIPTASAPGEVTWNYMGWRQANTLFAIKTYPGKCKIIALSEKYFAFFLLQTLVLIKRSCESPQWTFAVSILRSSPPSKVNSWRTVEQNENSSCKCQQKNQSGKDVISTGTNERLSRFCSNNLKIKAKIQSKLIVYVAVGKPMLNKFIFGNDT